MLIALLGWAPGLSCGVSDYTARLAEALESEGVRVFLPGWRAWNLVRATDYANKLRQLGATVVHVQYPSRAYERSLGPLCTALGARSRVVVTAHEWSQSHPLRKCVTATLLLAADGCVFTTESELSAWRKQCKGFCLGKRTAIIPLGSNLLAAEPVTGEERRNEVVYFGLIRPNKGLEMFLEVAARAWSERDALDFVIIGRTPIGCENYARVMKARARMLPNVIWVGGLEEEAVIRRMERAKVACLPYPDGVSERRGSTLAALNAGLAVVTTSGSGTTEELRRVVLTGNSVEEMLNIIRHLINHDEERIRWIERGRRWVNERSWSCIARKHLELYYAVLEGRRARGVV